MKVIGLCGGSGSGKGAVARILSSFGIAHIDTDLVYHEITSRPSVCLDALAAEFGADIIRDGALDRARLREIVFAPPNSTQKLARLNSITHKYIIDETERRIQAYLADGVKGVLIDAPLLYESGLDRRCDCVIAVVADRGVRLARIMLRDGISLDAAKKRIDSQLSDKALADKADYVIYNNCTLEQLGGEVSRVYTQIFEK